MIRKAGKDDFEYVFDLIMMASRLVFEDALNSKDIERIRELVYKYYINKHSKFSHTCTYVYEEDGEIAGCIIYYDSDQEESYNENMEYILDNEYKFMIEAEKNSVYLDTLSVLPKYRGKNISRKLIDYMIENTQKDISLIAEDHKEYVIDYYKRLGFEVVQEEMMYGSKVKKMLLKK